MSKPTEGSRSLHWVLKVGNLRKSVDFFVGVLGLRVLRHEEFLSGCEATCNGPYGGAWSKTMIGYGPELTNFALELTYNYGIASYKIGNDLVHIVLSCPAAILRARALGYIVEEEDVIVGPDNYRFKIVQCEKGRAERFVAVALRVSSLEASKRYWGDVLGLKTFATPQSLTLAMPSVCVSFDQLSQVALQFVQNNDGAVDHALANGRIAFACPTPSVNSIFEMISSSGHTVQTPPLTLPTPGKASVVVTILVDPDEYEICFVEDAAFYDLATPLYDVIDWEERASRGGDGSSLPVLPPMHATGTIAVTSADQFSSLVSGSLSVSIVEFGASWCKKCKAISPQITQLAVANPSIAVLTVDIDELQELSMELGISSVPQLLAYANGSIVDRYSGSSETEIASFFAKYN